MAQDRESPAATSTSELDAAALGAPRWLDASYVDRDAVARDLRMFVADAPDHEALRELVTGFAHNLNPTGEVA